MANRPGPIVGYAKNRGKTGLEFGGVMGLAQGKTGGGGYECTASRIKCEGSICFMNRGGISLEHHIAFNVDGHSFDQILNQLKEKKIAFGSSPYERENQRTNHDFAPRGLFWTNMDGCLFEVMTYEF